MTPTALKDRLLEDFDRLSPDLQKTIQELTHALASAGSRGVPARALLRHAGTIDTESAREMREAIGEGCEGVDPSEW